MTDILIRFVCGGVMVSLFAVLGDVLRPKSFAGLFGAAPSVALASLILTITSNGAPFAATEMRSMIGGAIAFFVYAWIVSLLMMRYRIRAVVATLGLLPIWLLSAFGIYFAALR